MHKKAITIIALAMSFSAQAEWSYIGMTDNATHYMDFSKIKKSPNGYRVWGVHDFKNQQKGGYLSSMWISEIDCNDERRRFLQVTGFSGHMGGGEILHISKTTGEWMYISPESSDATMMKLVCGSGK